MGIGWSLPYKQVAYPLLFALAFVQYLFEHRPELMLDFGSFLGPLTLAFMGQLIAFFYYAYKKGNKTHVVMAIVTFIVQSSVFVLYLQGPPPDTVEAAITALKDENYIKWHFVGHLFLLAELALASWCVPWETPEAKNNQ